MADQVLPMVSDPIVWTTTAFFISESSTNSTKASYDASLLVRLQSSMVKEFTEAALKGTLVRDAAQETTDILNYFLF